MPAKRILHGMQKVLGHDLPNQMVVLQSLLQLLDQEESVQLGSDGREYVRRLQNATRRASDMVRFLKEMSRLNAFLARSETIKLADLARELQGELQRLHPDQHFEFHWQWTAPTLVGDARVYLQALTELFAGVVDPQGRSCRVSAGSEDHGDAICLTFHLEEGRDGAPRHCTVAALEQRMEIILAREWLTLGSADVELTMPMDGGVRFLILVPSR